jgi:uncharacterized protein (DUF433 family)
MHSRIVSDPDICGGEPCITGTRVPVQVILSHLAAGDDEQTILTNFPRLRPEDIRASLEFAAWLCAEKALPFAS